MKALLVSPRFPVTYWGFQYGLQLIGKQASFPPLGLLTVAALLPDDWQLRLVDLNVQPLHDDDLRWADVVLTGGLLIQTPSILEIISRAAAFQLPVAIGGPAPTASPELFGAADVVFQGEAEGRIEELVGALESGAGGHVVLAAPESFPDLALVPVPRFDLLDLSRYAALSVQYSRGCPFQCEFCDVIEIFGRRPRVKSSAQVVVELEALHKLGHRGTVFFVDDNFIGNRTAVRQLLPLVREWQRERGQPFEFYTEASVDLAKDPQLLGEMVEAGFSSVFVGIETPSRRALEQANKLQNLRVDLSAAIEQITRAGLQVMGGFIVGFDTDGPEVFALQREFLARQPMPLAMVGMLTAFPGTALWRRLEAAGRLRGRPNGDQFSRPNFAPVMAERVLLAGYADLMTWLYSAPEYYRRCMAFLDQAGPSPEMRSSTRDEVGALLRTVWHIGIRSPRRRLFWSLLTRTLWRDRRQVRQAVTLAVQGEHLIRYTREHLVPRMEEALAEFWTSNAAEARPLLIDRDATPITPPPAQPRIDKDVPTRPSQPIAPHPQAPVERGANR